MDRFDQDRSQRGFEMTLLHLPYLFNIIVLIPVDLMTLLGGEKGDRSHARASSLRAKDSER
jgi:hypothetical protein